METQPQVVSLSAPLSKWTPKDEALLQELYSRKDRIMTARKRIVLDLVQQNLVPKFDIDSSKTEITQEHVVEFLITRADAVVKAIEHFTSAEVGK